MTRGLLMVAVTLALLLWTIAARGLVWAVEPLPLRIASLPSLATEPMAFARAETPLDTISFVDVVSERQLIGGLANGAIDVAVISPEQALLLATADVPVQVLAMLPTIDGDIRSAKLVVARADRRGAADTLTSAWRTAGERAAQAPIEFAALASRRLRRPIVADDVNAAATPLVTDRKELLDTLNESARDLLGRGLAIDATVSERLLTGRLP